MLAPLLVTLLTAGADPCEGLSPDACRGKAEKLELGGAEPDRARALAMMKKLCPGKYSADEPACHGAVRLAAIGKPAPAWAAIAKLARPLVLCYFGASDEGVAALRRCEAAMKAKKDVAFAAVFLASPGDAAEATQG